MTVELKYINFLNMWTSLQKRFKHQFDHCSRRHRYTAVYEDINQAPIGAVENGQ